MVLTVYTMLFSFPKLWRSVLGRHHIKEVYPFLDMKGRLAHMQAYAMGIDVYTTPNPLDPLYRKNDKPSFTLSLGRLGLGVRHAILAGIIFVVTTIVGSLLIVRPKTWLQVAIATLVICSPPVLLAIERANDDIIIYSFLLFVPFFMSLNSLIYHFFGFLIVSLLTPIKYYPLMAFSAIIYSGKSTQKKILWLIASILFVILFLIVSYQEITFLSSRIPSPTGSITFGSPRTMGYMISSLHMNPSWLNILVLLYIFILIASGILLALSERSAPLVDITTTAKEAEILYFLMGVSILNFCFFSNTNFDYRFIFWIFTLPLLFHMINESKNRNMSCFWVYLMIWISIIAMWVPWIYLYVKQTDWISGDSLLLAIDFSALVFRNFLIWLPISFSTVFFSLIFTRKLLGNFRLRSVSEWYKAVR